MREIFPKVTGKTPLVGVCQRYIADISAKCSNGLTQLRKVLRLFGVIVKRMTSVGFEPIGLIDGSVFWFS